MNVSDLLTKALIIVFVLSFATISVYYFYSSNYYIIYHKSPQFNKQDILNYLARTIYSAYFNNLYEFSVLVNLGNSTLYLDNLLNTSLTCETRFQYMQIPLSYIIIGFASNFSAISNVLVSNKTVYLINGDFLIPLVFYNINVTKLPNNRTLYYIQVIYLTSNSSYLIQNENEITFDFIKKVAQVTWIILDNDILVCKINNNVVFNLIIFKGDVVQFSFTKIEINILKATV